ncbi:hypothetical protein EMMF5_002038 [Cystobasidiomycetes sp. EMM_F5]
MTHDVSSTNPFHHDIDVDNGRLRRKDIKVGFHELFFDLFFVAALAVYTKEAKLATGADVASYILYFTLLWSTWAANAVYDVRFGSKDVVNDAFVFLHLLAFGVLAAVSGNFVVGYGLSHQEESPNLENVPIFIQRGESEGSSDLQQRSLLAASGVFFVLRILLLLRYAWMYTRAKKAGVARHSVLIVMLGLTASATLWAIGFGLSFSSDRPQSIARISLWSIGLAIEFLATAVSSAHSTALRIELEYWAERFAALTLIIIGEGIIGIYENFKSILDGFNLTRFANVFGSIFAAVGLYRILFAVATITASVSALNAVQQYTTIIQRLVTEFDSTGAAFGPNASVTAAAELLTESESGQELVAFLRNLGIDWIRNVQSFRYIAGNNVATFDQLFMGESLSILARVFAKYGFEVKEEIYNNGDEQIASITSGENRSYTSVFAEFAAASLKPTFTTYYYGLCTLGSAVLLIVALKTLQNGSPFTIKRHSYISYAWKTAVGIICICATPIFTAAKITAEELLNADGNLATSVFGKNYTLPVLFCVLVTIPIMDSILHHIQHWHKEGETEPLSEKTEQGPHQLLPQDAKLGTNGGLQQTASERTMVA